MIKPAAHHPWHPAKYQPEDSYAIQALAKGEANDAQQIRAMKWIIETLCGTYDETFHPGPDGARESDYAAGKRGVGMQLVKHVNGVPWTQKK